MKYMRGICKLNDGYYSSLTINKQYVLEYYKKNKQLVKYFGDDGKYHVAFIFRFDTKSPFNLKIKII